MAYAEDPGTRNSRVIVGGGYTRLAATSAPDAAAACITTTSAVSGSTSSYAPSVFRSDPGIFALSTDYICRIDVLELRQAKDQLFIGAHFWQVSIGAENSNDPIFCVVSFYSRKGEGIALLFANRT